MTRFIKDYDPLRKLLEYCKIDGRDTREIAEVKKYSHQKAAKFVEEWADYYRRNKLRPL